jgi:riboflavin synthase
MFTGLVEEIGTVAEIRRGGSIRLTVRARKVLDGLKLGDSIAVSGPCLTVEEIAGDRFWASLLPETASGTTLGDLRQGDRVNLERPLRLGDRLGGHMVSGHVDGVGTVRAARTARETARAARETARTAREMAPFRHVRIEAPSGLEQYLPNLASVSVDGVSLTVREPAGNEFSISLVAATLAATTLGDLRPGDRVNLEVDMVAKHIERLLAMREGGADSEKLMSWLAESET